MCAELSSRFCGIIEYDGTKFHGYQYQPNLRTVQGEIEKSLQKIFRSLVKVDGSGRTDAGVHSQGQVIAFTTVWKHTLFDLKQALNFYLPDDVVVSKLCLAPQQFSPRFDAVSRLYRYTIVSQSCPITFNSLHAYHIRHSLDIQLMNKACGHLIGRHDFSSFGKPPVENGNTVRLITKALWRQIENVYLFDISANAFLYQMVRRIVGILLQVGAYKLTIEEVKQLLNLRQLNNSFVAPPQGLSLVKVTYPNHIRFTCS